MILIDSNQLVDIELVEFEQVEIKGKGHPDTLCDLIAETASRMYSRYCIKEFGAVANHWFDKVMLIGGASEVSFGSSFLVKPYEVIFAGKVSNRVGEHTIPLDQILFQATSKILTDNLIAFDPSKGLVISNKLVDYQGTGRSRSRYQPSSTSELQSLNNWHQFESNDCNLVSSYSPLSRTEFLTKKLEEYFNGAEFKEKYPSTGTDIKIFSSRHKESLDIIANIPFIGRMVKSPSQYNELKDLIIKDTESMLSTLNHGLKVHFILNPHDKNNNFYLGNNYHKASPFHLLAYQIDNVHPSMPNFQDAASARA
jgi:S-adenosylmethionine synthetase